MISMMRCRLVTSLAVAGGLTLVAAGTTLPADAATRTGVATTTVNIRSGPSTSKAVVGGLVRGQRISVTGSAGGGWVKVRFKRTTAYIYGTYLNQTGKRLPAAPTKISSGTKITTETLNVRTGPGTTYRIVGSLAEGTGVKITGRFKSGKMSARMRRTATTAVSATAVTTTSTVTGRRSAIRTSHMNQLSPCKHPTSTARTTLRTQCTDKRGEIAFRDRLRQERAPDVHARKVILEFGLRQQVLRFRDFDNVCQA